MHSNRHTRLIAHLILQGDDFSADDVTQALGTPPNCAHGPTDKLKNGREAGFARWEICTGWVASCDLQEVINKLPLLGRRHTGLLVDVANRCNAKWDVVVGVEVWNEQKPSLALSRDTVGILAAMDAGIDIDYYCYGLEQEERHTHATAPPSADRQP